MNPTEWTHLSIAGYSLGVILLFVVIFFLMRAMFRDDFR